MVETLEAEVNKVIITQIFGKGRDGKFILGFRSEEKLGENWEGEMVVNSRGNYIYICPTCKISMVGDLKETLNNKSPVIMCYCQRGIDANCFAGEGPRIYLIKKD